MNNYLKIFQEEARVLLNSYKSKDGVAIERCQKVFGKRENLSLMNIQHVIAKEYGFNKWNDICNLSNSEIAQILIKQKEKGFTSPLTQWFDNKTSVENFENKKRTLRTEDVRINWADLTVKEPYQSIDFSYMDLSNRDLSALNLLDTTFTEDTVWPKDKNHLPMGISPQQFLQERKNPGLGISSLHKEGILGKDRNVVVIGIAGLGDHTEYHHNLKDYIEISDDTVVGGFRGNGEVSGIIGKKCGVAPESHLYYICVSDSKRSQEKYALAIRKACDIHRHLLQNHQNGVDVIEIRVAINSNVFENETGHQEVQKAISEAESCGIFIKTGLDESFGYKTVAICCKMGGDVENPKDYEILPFWQLLKTRPEIYKNQKILYFPGQWTVAGDLKMNSFVFNKTNPHVNAYIAGLYLLAKSVKEGLTPSEFYQVCYETGDEGIVIGRIVNAEKVIQFLKK